MQLLRSTVGEIRCRDEGVAGTPETWRIVDLGT